MSDNYCPFGKCQCLHYENTPSHFKFCRGIGRFVEFSPEVCPWPSRQVRLEPVADDPCAKCTCIDHGDSFAKGHAAGCLEQARAMKEAVDKEFLKLKVHKSLTDYSLSAEKANLLKRIFAALAAAEIKSK